MVEIKQSVSIYGSWKNMIDREEIDELNNALAKMEINCKVLYEADADGYSFIFMKEDR